MAPTPRLVLRGISKSYAATRANDGIDLAVMPGGIHALLGENGAGKSTLVKIIYGVAQPDAGRIEWEGREVPIPDPNAARRLGIGMVFQHFSLFETLTVAENIALGLGGAEPLPRLAARIAATAAEFGLAVDPARHVHHLSVGERQRVEILRCLMQAPRLLIMDEPTSVLTPQEAEALFALLRRLAAEGCSVLYISHRLAEIRALCDRATVLRAGRVVGECDPRTTSAAELAEMMIGRPLAAPAGTARREPGPVVLAAHGLTLAADDPFGTDLRGVSLEVRSGEILGIAGVAGNGQTELLAALTGERLAPEDRQVVIAAVECGRMGAAARRRLGLASVPEERLGRGAVAELSLTLNALLTGTDGPMVRHGFIRFGPLRRFAQGVIDAFRVVAAGTEAPAGSLSGGNVQKFIIGREVGHAPRALVAAHPTWGVDVGAALSIHDALRDLAASGVGVLVVSEDLDELLALCDRIAVLHGGRLSPAMAAGTTSVPALGLLMGGLGHDAAA
jgi:simple sugar transport system ATP-binding protein